MTAIRKSRFHLPIVKVNGCDVAVCLLASVTFTVKLDVPVFAGRPEIMMIVLSVGFNKPSLACFLTDCLTILRQT